MRHIVEMVELDFGIDTNASSDIRLIFTESELDELFADDKNQNIIENACKWKIVTCDFSCVWHGAHDKRMKKKSFSDNVFHKKVIFSS